MMILLGDTVTTSRELAGATTYITGRVSGIVQKDNGDLKYFYIRGVDTPLYISDGWMFEEEFDNDNDEREEEDGEI
jgi:hypothetical protein